MKRTIISLLLGAALIFSVPSSAYAESQLPNIYGKKAITVDVKTGEIIYAKDVDSKAYPASMTKLMTALLLAEKKQKTDQLSYTADAKKQPEFSINVNMHPIAVGEKMSASDVMDALLLPSGNDMATMIADNVGANTDDFVKMMNAKVKQLKLKNTNFVTPNGLHDDNHYTTAYDMSVIAREAFKNPWVKETVAKKSSKVSTSAGTVLVVQNRNSILGQDNCVGGKTGYTSEAGKCLTAFFNKDGREIVGVVMKSVYDAQDKCVFDDMKKIVDWSYNEKPVVLHEKGKVLKTVKVTYKPLKFFGPSRTVSVPVYTNKDITYYDNYINKKEVKEDYNLDKLNVWKLSSSTPVGTLTVTEREAKKTYNLYTNASNGIGANLLFYGLALLAAVVVIGLFIFIIRAIRKAASRGNRRRRRY